jgi:hypothetical protein
MTEKQFYLGLSIGTDSNILGNGTALIVTQSNSAIVNSTFTTSNQYDIILSALGTASCYPSGSLGYITCSSVPLIPISTPIPYPTPIPTISPTSSVPKTPTLSCSNDELYRLEWICINGIWAYGGSLLINSSTIYGKNLMRSLIQSGSKELN